MAAAQYAPHDPGQIDFDAFGSDVDEHDFKTQGSCPIHHLKVILPGKRGLYREAPTPLQIFPGQTQDFASSANGGSCRGA